MFLQKKSILLLVTVSVFFACKNEPKNPESTQTIPADTIRPAEVSLEGSVTYTITEGIVNCQIKKGSVVLDMYAITVTDIKDPGERRDLESHLKDSDFFEVNKYPKAEFVFEEVLPGKAENFNWVLNGHLTMKGKKVPLTIPVMIRMEGDVLQAESPAFPINRTLWGVNFQSGILGTARDKMIDDMVPLMLKVTAKKQPQ
jgi:hypothetical protein